MPLNTEHLKFAIDDVRKRQQGLVDLIHASDRQAMGMLQVYIALAVASLSGSAVILLSPTNALPRLIGYGLAGFAFTVTMAAIAALVVMWPANVLLPGRKPNFWLWADEPETEIDYALRKYLSEAHAEEAINKTVNEAMGRAMFWAKALGAASPVAGYVAGSIAFIARL